MENRPQDNMESATVGGGFLLADCDPGGVFVPEDFTPEDRLIGQTADDFLRREVLPHVEQIESGDHALMHRLMQQAGSLGLLAADIPMVYGGLGLKVTTAALIAEKLNWQQSFALTHEAHTVIATLPLLYFGNNEQKARYLPKLASGEWVGSFALSEANAGSDALGAQAKATLSPDGQFYILNGAKAWITNTAFAQLFTVFAKVDGIHFTAFLVERDSPGLTFGPEEQKLGMRGTSTRRVILDNVPVPVINALPVGRGQYAAFCALNMGRFKLEAGAVGGLKEMLTVCTAYAGQRKAFGRSLDAFGLVQHKLAEMAARIFSLESMVYRLAGDLDSIFAPIVPDAEDASGHYHHAAEEYAVECCIVKVIGSEMYSRLTDEAIQIHGGYGYTEKFPVARAWRDQRLLRIGEGANEVVRLAIINVLLRRDKQGRLPVLAAGARIADELGRALTNAEADRSPIGRVEDPLDAIGAGGESTVMTDRVEDPLDSIGAAASGLKRLALALLHYSSERLGPELLETQEIAASVADIICAAYAVESVWHRVAKLRKFSGEPRSETALLMAQIAARNHTEEALTAAHYVLDSLPPTDDGTNWRDLPPNGLTALLDRLARWDSNPMQQRRQLAAQVIECNGYPLE